MRECYRNQPYAYIGKDENVLLLFNVDGEDGSDDQKADESQ